MGKVFNYLSAILGLLVITSCEFDSRGFDRSSLPKSSGKYGEVLVVLDTSLERKATGKEIEQIFNKALDALPQQEAQFRMSTVDEDNFKSILKRSRNILKINVGSGKKTKIDIRRDVWASNQLLINITATSNEKAAEILKKNRQTIRDYFNEEELSRLKKQFKKKTEKKLEEKIENEHHIDLTIPPAFVLMNYDSSSFWIKKEKSIGEHPIMQAVMVYYYPYVSDSALSRNELVQKRNKYTKDKIQTPAENAYMVVYDEYTPIEKEISLNGMYSKELRGLWKMENDFMGGPFIHYTIIDEQRNRVINLDGFVYAPKFNKREYLRELEAIIKTIKLPSS